MRRLKEERAWNYTVLDAQRVQTNNRGRGNALQTLVCAIGLTALENTRAACTCLVHL